MSNLRPYGPGKYTHIVDSRVDELIPDAELGSVYEDGVHFALIRGSFWEELNLEGLTDDEVSFLKKQVGAIIKTNSDGFVTIDYFDTEDALNKAWDEIENHFMAEYNDDEEDDIEEDI